MGTADDIRAKQQQAAAAASDLRHRQAASFASLRPAIRAAAPEIARLCRQVRLRGDGDGFGYGLFNTLSNLLWPRWRFELYTTRMTITIYWFGGWRFTRGKKPRRSRWTSTHVYTPADIQSPFAAQVEQKAIEQARR